MTSINVHNVMGERLDVILDTDQRPNKYSVIVRGLQDCRGLHHEAFLLYDGVLEEEQAIQGRNIFFTEDNYAIAEQGYACRRISENVVCIADLRGLASLNAKNAAEETFYIPYDTNVFNDFTDEMSDNSYNIYDCTFYPAYLTLRKKLMVPQINNMTFRYPSSPILSQPENTPENIICSPDKRATECASTPLFCECIQILEIGQRKVVELILIDEGFGSNVTHTFHVHGYDVSILGRKSFGHPITKKTIISLDRMKNLPRNFINPPKTDTFTVPNKGYIILRFYTDNPGYWLFEATSIKVHPGVYGPGMQFLMRVGTRESMPTVPINFPSCGNNKGPDMIFENN